MREKPTPATSEEVRVWRSARQCSWNEAEAHFADLYREELLEWLVEAVEELLEQGK